MSTSKKMSRFLPWLVTSAILVYMFYSYDLQGALDAARAVDATSFSLLVVLGVLVPWFVDSVGFWIAFSRLHPDCSFSLTQDLLPLRAVSYFLNVINYGAVGGGIALFLKARKGIPFIEALSSFLFVLFIDFLVVSFVNMLGLLFTDTIPASMRFILWSFILGIFVFFVGALIYWRGGFDFWFAGRFRSWGIFSAFSKAKLFDYLVVFGVRLALFVVYMVIEFPLLRLFGVRPSVGEFSVYFPMLTFISILPVSIASLGLPQEATIRFYTPFATSSHAVFAYTMIKVVVFNLARVLLGYFYMVRTGFQSGARPEDSSNE